MTNFELLIKEIFITDTDIPKTISEKEFCILLPELFSNNRPVWNSKRFTKLILLKFGLNGNDTHTDKEIGKIFNVSGARIFQLKHTALRTLRYGLNREKYIIK